MLGPVVLRNVFLKLLFARTSQKFDVYEWSGRALRAWGEENRGPEKNIKFLCLREKIIYVKIVQYGEKRKW